MAENLYITQMKNGLKLKKKDNPAGLLNEELLQYYDPNEELTPELLVDLQSGNYDRGIVAMPYIRQSDQSTVYTSRKVLSQIYMFPTGCLRGIRRMKLASRFIRGFERYVKIKLLPKPSAYR